MYQCSYLRLNDVCEILGLGHTRVYRIFQERTHGFPSVKIGNRYQVDEKKFYQWKDRWDAGEFSIDD